MGFFCLRCGTAVGVLLVWSGLFLLTSGQCPPGRFGPSCQFLCHCADDSSCDVTTGTCPGGCDVDYGGPVCQARLVHMQATTHRLTRSSPPGVDTFVIKLAEAVPLNRIYFVGNRSLLDEKLDLLNVFHVEAAGASCFISTLTKGNKIVIPVDCKKTSHEIKIRVVEDLSKFVLTSQFSVLVCTDNFYGLFCDAACDQCKNGTVCDHMTGLCPDGCAAGYLGSKCDSACGNDTFGDNCNSTCGSCRGGRPCNHVTGSCAEGCAEGWEGELCTLPCERGMFGENCSQLCADTCGAGEACHHVTGGCLLNHTVARNPVPVLDGDGPSLLHYLQLAGIGVGAAVLLALLLSVTAYVLWKRHVSKKITLQRCSARGGAPAGRYDFSNEAFGLPDQTAP